MGIEVHRLPKSRGGFERAPNQATRSRDLSIAALGLLVRLLTDGSDYDSIDAIADDYSSGEEGKRQRGRGRDAYRVAARELEAAGYLVRARTAVDGVLSFRIEVFAEPGRNVRSLPTTVQPSSQRPAETTPNPSSESTTLEPSSDPTCENEANTQVAPDDGSTVLASYTDLFTDLQTSSPYPLPSSVPEPGTSQAEGGGGAIAQGEMDSTITAAATKLVNSLPYTIHKPGRAQHAALITRVASAMADGLPYDALHIHLVEGIATARSRVAVWLDRLEPCNLPVLDLPTVVVPVGGGFQPYQDPDPSSYDERL